MHARVFRRALTFAAVVALLLSMSAYADVVRADGDLVAPDYQGFIELGEVGPGAVIHVDVGFALTCAGSKHVNADQSVLLTLGSRTVPTGGDASATATAIDPPGTGWPADGADCSANPEPVWTTTPSHVTITAPKTPNTGYPYTLTWNRTLSPVTATDSGTFSGIAAVTFSLDVVANTPPSLSLPSSVTIEGDTSGGAFAAYSAGATDAEDEPDPMPTCAPSPGAFVPLGTTTVTCSATDSGGLTATASFPLTVVDTTAPVLSGVPDGLDVAAADASGAAIAYADPTASDIVDPSPDVSCLPASGSVVPPGDSTVTCTATDDTGNVATASFPVHVDRTPVLQLPADSVIEGNTTGGAIAAWTVSASDAEDDPDPTPACSPAPGTVLPLGTTTVSCTVTDSHGLAATGTFEVTVVDTTAPRLRDLPGTLVVTTADPSGAVLAYEPPTASDVVDAAPSVSCLPASGTVVPVGDTQVSCSATDHSGNVASATFTVHVLLSWAAWDEPVSGLPGSISANAGRSIPVKVRLFVGGVEVTEGAPVLSVSHCDGASTGASAALEWRADRWFGHLDTSGLAGGCYQTSIDLGGSTIPGFRLDLSGDASALRGPVKRT